MSIEARLDYEIIVVGGGPTGLISANLLGRSGVKALLVERNSSTVQEPRAVSIDDEALRTIQAIGVADSVVANMVAGYGSEYLTPSGKTFLKVEPSGTPYGFPRRNAFRQPVLERQLRDHLRVFPSVETLFGWQVDEINQSADHVELGLLGPDGTRRTVCCAYVVAADGASSFVRETLGLTLDGQTFSEKWLIVDLENSPAPSRETLVFCDVRRPCIALPGPNSTRRFEFKLLPSDDASRMTDPAMTGPLLSQHGAAPQSRVVRRTVYAFHARLAPQWSRGRVFLAGDACHLTPPFAGQGMNSGIRDAHNIAWKLTWVLNGTFSPDLLETYQQERQGHVSQMITLALRMGRIMAPPSRLAGFLTQTSFRLLGVWKPLKAYFGQMKYKPKPRFAHGFVLADGRPRRQTAVGRLLPQPIVGTPEGDRLLDDLLGDGFALIAFTDDVAYVTAVASLPELKILKPRQVIVTNTQAALDVQGGVRVIRDTSRALERGLDFAPGRFFLVRPDRYVAGAFTFAGSKTFARRLSRFLASPAILQSLDAAPPARDLGEAMFPGNVAHTLDRAPAFSFPKGKAPRPRRI